MRNQLLGAIFVGTLAWAAPSFAGTPTFTMLAIEDAVDVTVDEFGRTLILCEDAGAVYIYESGIYDYLGVGFPKGLSADGTYVAGGYVRSDGLQEAARGSTGLGWEPLGDLGTCDFFMGTGYDVSADGSTVVGLAWPGCNSSGFTWSSETGMLELDKLGNGNNRASVVSDDGQVIAGFAQGTFMRTPAVWSASDRTGWLFDIDGVGEIESMSPDGSILAGRYADETISTGYQEPFYWTAEGDVVFIPSLPDYPGGSVLGVSEDGGTLVGYSGIVSEGRTAMVWRPEWGMVDLGEKLAELNVPVPDNLFLQVSRAVSDDGLTVVGWGILVTEEEVVARGFIATLPEREPVVCTEDLDGDGQVGFTDLTQLLGTWGPCDACPEDLDGDDQVGFTDLTQLLGNWGPCL